MIVDPRYRPYTHGHKLDAGDAASVGSSTETCSMQMAAGSKKLKTVILCGVSGPQFVASKDACSTWIRGSKLMKQYECSFLKET